ncbi:hypothetical protein [Jiella pacifica]|uniref:Uncharacterized protein n=1 Tax=Jiella pacifica TaxID=2696469 RepID=A0A6N9T2D7_9HYPH|nr:hypothetical protein [Jiella pacifica]NDW04039.1 hypothetical protein [Jiella pacifica]
MARARDTQTLDIFDWQPPQVAVGYDEDVAGRGPLDMKIARILSRALQEYQDETGLSRGEVATKIGEHLDRIVTKNTVYKWTSPSATENRIHLDEFAAVIHVTGKTDLLGFLPGLFGYAVVSSEHKEIIRNHEMREHKKRIETYHAELDAQIAASDARLRGRR